MSWKTRLLAAAVAIIVSGGIAWSARNGSGSYSAPSNSWNPVVSGTTIDSSDFNDLLDDLETALSESIARDGQTATTAEIPFASGIATDTISEDSANAGVTIDGVLIKDDTITFEGSTADAFETTVAVTDPTADRTITLPDATGTVMLNLVEDTTPQLGGDLGLNGNAIDFPTTANISDVLDEDDMSSDSATALATQQSIKAYVDDSSPLPRGYLAGLQLSNNGTDSDHDIDVAAGECRNASNDGNITLSAITKQIDATWAAGTDAGGLSSSLTAPANDTWYHVFAIVVGGSADVGFDTSVTGANLVTDHSATAVRRIGAVLTDGSANIIAFYQTGDFFGWVSPPQDLSGNVGSSGLLVTLSVPPDVRVTARTALRVRNTGGAQALFVMSPDVNVAAAAETAQAFANAANESGTAEADVITNTSSQIRADTTDTTNGTNSIRTVGWIDRRGRDD